MNRGRGMFQVAVLWLCFLPGVCRTSHTHQEMQHTHTHAHTGKQTPQPTKTKRAGSRHCSWGGLAVFTSLFYIHTHTHTYIDGYTHPAYPHFHAHMHISLCDPNSWICSYTLLVNTCMSVLWSAVVRMEAFRKLSFIIQGTEILFVLLDFIVCCVYDTCRNIVQ